jgi:FAD/FMN-containing dehydrogenase
LANGTITTVSETEQPDLYWALRGGANNFGIVTSFTVGVFPLGQVYTGFRSFPDNVTTQFLEEAEKLFSIEDNEDTNVVLEYTYSYNAAANTYSMSSTQRYFEPIMNPSVYESLNSLPALAPLSGGLGTLAASTAFGGTLGRTR